MTSVPSWEQFKQYWDSEGTRHMVVDGAVGGIVGGFLGGIIISILIWLCMRQVKSKKIYKKHVLEPHESPYFNNKQKINQKQLIKIPSDHILLSQNKK